MFKRILIPVDGSPRAEAILRQIARLLRHQEAHFVFVHAIEPALGYPGVDAAALADRDREEAKSYLRDLTGRLARENVRVSAVIREGAAADVILAAAKDEEATMIAMTTHGRTGLARWTLGSVSEKVLRGAELPVLLMRSYRPEGTSWTPVAPEEAPFRRILVPTDGGEIAGAPAPAVAMIAREFDAEVAALHVVPSRTDLLVGHSAPPMSAADPSLGEKVASELLARFSDQGLKTRVFGAVGDPAEKILETAASYGADLIAMSTHGRTGLARLGFGSVTERVLRGATVPMLVVRGTAKRSRPARKRAAKAGASA